VGSIAKCESPTFPRDCTSEARLTRTYRQLEQQLDRLRAHAAARGWDLAQEHVFRDDGYR
jgi:hypothetical protein